MLQIRSLLAVLTLAAWSLVATEAKAETTPPSLMGEFLNNGSVVSSGSVDCNPGDVSSFTFYVEGPAYGPYPGTFAEEGSGSFSTEPVLNVENRFIGYPLRFDSTFHIDSPIGEVTGTKTLIAPLPGIAASCAEPRPGLKAATNRVEARYEATITTAFGTFRDSGTALIFMSVHCIPDGSCRVGDFNETFVQSDGVTPIPTREGVVTGGGQVGAITFAVEARAEGARLDGRCNVVDGTTRRRLTCLDVRSVAVVGRHATITGKAEVEGVTTNYRINVDDLGEPGFADTFEIDTDIGYALGGPVTEGNIQVQAPGN